MRLLSAPRFVCMSVILGEDIEGGSVSLLSRNRNCAYMDRFFLRLDGLSPYEL
jgi:hypothetical protein